MPQGGEGRGVRFIAIQTDSRSPRTVTDTALHAERQEKTCACSYQHQQQHDTGYTNGQVEWK